VRIWQSEIVFRKEIGGYMENAAAANTIELATKEMEKVMAAIDTKKYPPGFTSSLYNTPDEDVGFWVTNMRSSLEELKQIKSDAASLEKSNVLIKLRETLTEKEKDKSSVRVPDGISVYPHNTLFALWGWISAVLAIVSCCIIFSSHDD
jgi:hypothetical protein